MRRAALVLVLAACRDHECWVSHDCGEVTCATCAQAPSSGWVQCSDGFVAIWGRPTSATIEQAMEETEAHCDSIPSGG